MPEPAISALLIPYEFDIDADYIRAFAPQILDTPHSIFSNAVILPLAELWPDQINFLTSLGIVQVEAKLKTWDIHIDTDETNTERYILANAMLDEIKRDHYICAIQVETRNQGHLYVITGHNVPRTR